MTGMMSRKQNVRVFVGLTHCHIGHTLDDQVWTKDTHGGNTNASLSSTISSAEAGEDNGGGAAHGTEEGLYCSISPLYYFLVLHDGCENSLVANEYVDLKIVVNLRRRRGCKRENVSLIH